MGEAAGGGGAPGGGGTVQLQDTLPADVLPHILSFVTSPNALCACETVCHAWRDAAANDDLWRGMWIQRGWGGEVDGVLGARARGRAHASDAGISPPAAQRASDAGARGSDWRSRFVARFLQEVELKRRAREIVEHSMEQMHAFNLAMQRQRLEQERLLARRLEARTLQRRASQQQRLLALS